ncbi:MAG: class I mannose-6-phosphate isomerase [Planctomycetota bacterium]|nr:MAG: class I mannose-6-phosphate isomerase [Planctomycetota bacterium]
MPQPYPLLFEPFFQDYLWGGRKLGTVLGKPIPPHGVWAESWEVVEHPTHTSRIINGPLAGKTLADVRTTAADWLLGSHCTAAARFPLLLKYLDCQRVLSVQVHPDDDYASRMPQPDQGKTEAWYIIDREPGARIYAGLQPGVSPEDLRAALANGDVERLLHVLHPEPGDAVFIPAGTVHALGAGLLVAEIQQSSNATFRLFDWNRVGPDGQPRPLHIDQALDVIDFHSGPRTVQTPQPTASASRQRLVQCQKFVLDRVIAPGDILAGDDRFHIITVPIGSARLRYSGGELELSRGQSALLPAAMEKTNLELNGAAVLLDMFEPAP